MKMKNHMPLVMSLTCHGLYQAASSITTPTLSSGATRLGAPSRLQTYGSMGTPTPPSSIVKSYGEEK